MKNFQTMIRTHGCFVSIIFFLLLSNACKKESKRAFYYWRTVFQLSAEQKKSLDALQISKLYIHFFDVDIDKTSGRIYPNANIRFKDKVPTNFEIVPVVYIVNSCLKPSKTSEIPQLSENISKQIQTIARQNEQKYSEVQIDCDWTESTKENYFNLLGLLKSKLKAKKVLLSATIRLHQIKYRNKTGVPPVDKGMLMYYNMGKIVANAAPNSIYNAKNAAKYVDFCNTYPLALDLVLPSFSWGIHIRDNRVIELLNNMGVSDFENNANFKQMDEFTFITKVSFFYRGHYFMQNDPIKIEEISLKESLIAAKQVNKKFNPSIEVAQRTIALYHLDSLIFKRNENKDFEKVFNTFN